MRKTELAALLYLSYCCNVAVSVLYLFLTVPLVGLHSVSVAFPGCTFFLFIRVNLFFCLI